MPSTQALEAFSETSPAEAQSSMARLSWMERFIGGPVIETSSAPETTKCTRSL